MGDPDLVARELQEPGHPVGRVHVVVDDEDSQAVGRRPSSGPPSESAPGAGGLGGGEPDDELAPLAGAVARRGDGAAVQLGERPDERQPDARAPLRAGERAVALGEEVEHPREQLGRDADPVVPDADDDLVPLDPGDELDAAPGRRVLGGVGQEVHEDLLEPGRVGLEPQVGRT